MNARPMISLMLNSISSSDLNIEKLAEEKIQTFQELAVKNLKVGTCEESEAWMKTCTIKPYELPMNLDFSNPILEAKLRANSDQYKASIGILLKYLSQILESPVHYRQFLGMLPFALLKQNFMTQSLIIFADADMNKWSKSTTEEIEHLKLSNSSDG